MTTATPPRRNWHLQRWLLLLAAGFLAYGGWTQYAFRAALKEARALGWRLEYTDPSKEIRQNWKVAFRKETWLDGVTFVSILTSERFEQHLAIVHRLNPRELHIYNASSLRDLSALRPLTRLQVVSLDGCTGLTNVDALKNLPALELIYLGGCTGLTNVETLKNLSALQEIYLRNCTALTNVDALNCLFALKTVNLDGCTGLTKESVASLRAALPNAEITDP